MRRSRWTVTLATGEKFVALAYDGAGAIRAVALVKRRDIAGATAARGDYRKRTRRVTGAKPNMLAIREACAFLDVKLPVKVRVTNHQGGCMGQHRARYDAATRTWSHDILVKSWLTVEQMGETLWHELAHAMQFERDALTRSSDPFTVRRAWHAAYRDGTTYRHKPYEVEARSYEHHNAEIALAR